MSDGFYVSDTDANTKAGLKIRYFARYNFDDCITCRTRQNINFDWSSTPPNGIDTVDGMSVRWEGFITPEFSEIYTFETNSNNGVRLWVDNTLLFDENII